MVDGDFENEIQFFYVESRSKKSFWLNTKDTSRE